MFIRTRVIRQSKHYYVQFLKQAQGFASEFTPMKWEYYGHQDEEGQFNRHIFNYVDDATEKAKMLANFNAIEVIAEFE